MARRIKARKEAGKRAHMSEGEFGWRPFFRERVVATVVESGNLGEEIDVLRAKFEVTISFASPQPWETSTDFLCFWSEVGIFLLQKMVLGESRAGCPAMLGLHLDNPEPLNLPPSKHRWRYAVYTRGEEPRSSLVFRKAGVRDEKGSPCLLSPQEPHRCVTVSSLPVPLACLPKMALPMSVF